MKTINLNETVRVALTLEGLKILFNSEYHGVRNKESDEDGLYSFQLWDLMNVFGTRMTVGSPAFFKDNDIIIK